MTNEEKHQCCEPDCTDFDTTPCQIPDTEKIVYYCFNHAKPNGFCYGCGEFWGGVEAFEFAREWGNVWGYCPNCSEAFDIGEDDENEDDEYYLM